MTVSVIVSNDCLIHNVGLIWVNTYLLLKTLPCGSAGKESICSVGDLGSIPGLERSPGDRKGHPHQYTGLENSMDYTVANGSQRVEHN